ncbi:MAG: hypothetical protein KAI66_05135 [Lentisphaeria bacterium]|nr:hypothetical protein [Lentisphaeria bacterium]
MQKWIEKVVVLSIVFLISMPMWAVEKKLTKGQGEKPVKPAAKEAVKANPKEAVEADPKDIPNKLLKLTTLEDAFKRALKKRNLLRRFVVIETRKIEEATTEDVKTEARKNIGEAKKQLHTLQTAMNVVFGTGSRREYQYNEVDSTIYLKVGTVEEAFARTVRTRKALATFIAEKRKEAKGEKDAKAKAELEKRVAVAVRQYQTVAAALQVIYQVTPARNYEYNPKNSTLYLKISENEVEKLRAQVKKLQVEAAEKKQAGKQK